MTQKPPSSHPHYTKGIHVSASARRIPLTRLFAAAMTILLLLFVVVVSHAYLRLVDFRQLLGGVTEQSIPALASANKIFSQVNTLTYLTERLTQAGSDAARRVSFNQISTELSELRGMTRRNSLDPFILTQLDALTEEFDELNALVAKRLEITAGVAQQLRNMYALYDQAALLSGEEAIGQSNPRGVEWLLSLADIVALAAEASDMNRLYQVRELGKTIELKLTLLKNQLPLLSDSSRPTGIEVTSEIEALTIGSEGIINSRLAQLRIDGRTRGRGNFVRNLIVDHAGLAEFESEELNIKVLQDARQISDNIALQTRIVGIISLVVLLIFVLIMYLLHIRVVGRLKRVNHHVKWRLAGDAETVHISGNDEITDLAATFEVFAHTIEAQKQTLHDLSLSDGLTGIANRRAFDMRLEQEIDNARRHRWPVTIMLIDVDFFKPYNDQYGHAKGDDCLVKIAQTLSSQMQRKADFLARYGGEEFICVLPDTHETGAAILAQQLLDAIRKRKIPHEFSQVADVVTVSIGITTQEITADKPLSPRTLFKQADDALYKAKQQGRDQWASYQQLNNSND